MTLSSNIYAQSQVVANGLEIELLEQLDLTYQIIPDYDEREYVLAGWDGEDLQYFSTFSKLPPGWLESEKWFAGFKRDIENAGGGKPIEILDQGNYKTDGNYTVHYLEYRFTLEGEPDTQHQIASFMADSRNSYLVSTTLINKANADQMRSETINVLRTAKVPSVNIVPIKIRSEDKYIGTWGEEAETENGDQLITIFELKSDLTFVGQKRLNGEPVYNYSGVWALNHNKITWTYLYHSLEESNYKLSELDEVREFDDERMIIVDSEDGKEHVFVRAHVK
jgi:hypothetical protein